VETRHVQETIVLKPSGLTVGGFVSPWNRRCSFAFQGSGCCKKYKMQEWPTSCCCKLRLSRRKSTGLTSRSMSVFAKHHSTPCIINQGGQTLTLPKQMRRFSWPSVWPWTMWPGLAARSITMHRSTTKFLDKQKQVVSSPSALAELIVQCNTPVPESERRSTEQCTLPRKLVTGMAEICLPLWDTFRVNSNLHVSSGGVVNQDPPRSNRRAADCS